ncbi:MAG: type II toxin-antitoxin system HicA family toxin [Acidobacteriota bacterium]
MGAVPVPGAREVITMLRKLGFEEVRQRGSHEQFRHQAAFTACRRGEAWRR